MTNLFARRRIMYMPGQYPGIVKHWTNFILWWFEDFKTFLFSIPSIKILPEKKNNKRYREDLNLWEERRHFLFLIPFYQYSIFKDGKLRTSFSLFKRSKATVKYLFCIELPLVSVDKKEFAEKYQNNKWLIPINKKLKIA